MPKGQGFFGHQTLAEQLARRLRTHFADGKADASLAIGIFGEWGSGKSNLLQLIGEDFAKAMQARRKGESAGDEPPVFVVAFNPWRYEKEEHLLVPLLKTLQLSIENPLRGQEQYWPADILEKLQKGATFLAMSALAFMTAFKGKLTLPGTGLEIEMEPAKAMETILKLIEGPEAEKSPLAKLESHCYEFERELREFVTEEPPVRLLFLIDDLDRCLPEKAVEMLESIKLFLDVEGCAFVLALDDEVVERGIVHRYRDYIFQGNGQPPDQKSLAQLPITGPEYLEKIIHLPFRLPQPSRFEIRQFLRGRFPHLFEANPVELAEAAGEPLKAAGRLAGRAEPRQAEELLSLFVNHIPPVPRKQIRSAELLSLLLDMAKARQCEQQIKPLPLAKLSLLQLFAPELYRFGRRRFLGFMRTLQEWAGHEHWGQKGFGEDLKNQIKTPIDKAGGLSESQQVEARNFDRFYAPLIEALETAAHNRSGFDPFQFIKSFPLPADDMQDLSVYFSFVDEAGRGLAETPAGEVSGLPVAELANADAFLDLLFSESEGSWQSAVQMPELQGRILDDATFGLLWERLQKPDFTPRLANPVWLRWLSPCLSQSQFARLAESAGQFGGLLPENLSEPKGDEEARQLFGQVQWLAVLRPDQQADLAGPVEKMRAWLGDIVGKQFLAVETRAEASRILSDLGDPRPGVTVKRSKGQTVWRMRGQKNRHALPDIDWQAIPADSFQMGTEGEAGDAREKPAHTVSLPGFFISRFPVTNAQYRCFVDAGMYEDEAFWRERLPEAAHAWRQGGAADEVLLAGIKDKDAAEFYRRWLADDQDRSRPRFWRDKQWNLDNHPVVGVSWFEALAYAVWLNELLPAIKPDAPCDGLSVRLPSEAEWEYAARGPSGLAYAWGNESGPERGNCSDTKLGRTSAAGLFPPGEAFDLHDMSGNVWEWCLSRWGADVDESAFTYRDWQAQEKQRNLVEPVEFRIARGGSWYVRSGNARCAVRNRYHPSNRDSYLGFRVVLCGVLPGAC
jgi:formylglycine-generating enzyme required for sulfatase activity